MFDGQMLVTTSCRCFVYIHPGNIHWKKCYTHLKDYTSVQASGRCITQLAKMSVNPKKCRTRSWRIKNSTDTNNNNVVEVFCWFFALAELQPTHTSPKKMMFKKKFKVLPDGREKNLKTNKTTSKTNKQTKSAASPTHTSITQK